MAEKTWKLIDVAEDVCIESLEMNGAEAGRQADCCRARIRTLRGGLRDGVRLLEIENGTLRVAIVPDRGMSVWKMWHCDPEIGETEIGWQSPVPGPVHPQYVPVAEPSGLGFLDGFDEMFVRCGLVSNGAPEFDESGRVLYPLHGRIGNLPASELSVSIDGESGIITVTGVVDECRFHFAKLRLTSTLTLRPNKTGFAVHDEVKNLSGNPGEMQILYHINFGTPLHGPGGELVAAVDRIVPRSSRAAKDMATWHKYGPAEVGSEEQVFFFRLFGDTDNKATTLLKSPDASRGVSVEFDTRQLPCFTLWKNTPPFEDGYVTGLEPGTNFPNPRSHEAANGRIVKLAAGAAATFDLRVDYHPDATSVAQTETAIRSAAQAADSAMTSEPLDDWLPG